MSGGILGCIRPGGAPGAGDGVGDGPAVAVTAAAVERHPSRGVEPCVPNRRRERVARFGPERSAGDDPVYGGQRVLLHDKVREYFGGEHWGDSAEPAGA